MANEQLKAAGAIAAGAAIGPMGMVAVAAPMIAGAPAPAGGGGFLFKVEELDQVIKDWEDLHLALTDDEIDARAMAQVQPPGNEFASADFAGRANPSGKAFLEANERMRDYVMQYIEALKKARKKISTQDEQAREDVNNAAGGLNQ